MQTRVYTSPAQARDALVRVAKALCKEAEAATPGDAHAEQLLFTLADLAETRAAALPRRKGAA